jgi:membrane-associated phospholipid phosphatase
MMAHTQAGVTGLDDAARSVVSMHSHKALNDMMQALTAFGDEVTLLFMFGALAVWAYAVRGAWWARFFVLVAAGALALDNIIKPLVDRPRPIFDQLVNGRGPSWPSGHTTGTTALLVALAIYASAGRGRGLRVALWTAALAGSILMGITRVYLGVHWPTDVMAAVILGIA